MPTRKGNNAGEGRDEDTFNEWAELRKTLLAMQENIQATITNSIHELGETVLNNQFPQQELDSESSEDSLDNPFARKKFTATGESWV